MLDEIKCKKCEATFKSGKYLNDDSVCEQCIKLGIKSRDERRQNPDEKENEGRLKNVIAKEVDEILLKYGVLNKCACGNSFYKRGPAQKGCGNCKGTDKKETK